MKNLFVIITSIFIACSMPTKQEDRTIIQSELDSLLSEYQFDGNTNNWPRPKYQLWEHWNGTGYYRTSDTTLKAWDDTIVRPDMTGWITDGRPSVNWDSCSDNRTNINGIREDGMPYFLDSLEITSYDISRDPLIQSSWVNDFDYWYPNIFPSYIKWRQMDPFWSRWWGMWPENPDDEGNIFRPDSDSYHVNIGDTVDIMVYLFPNYQREFMYNHKDDTLWTNSSYGYLWSSKMPYNMKSDDWGIVLDRRISHINSKMRYYKVIDSFGTITWKVFEEVRKNTRQIDWNNGGN